jgi:hypothetical protein
MIASLDLFAKNASLIGLLALAAFVAVPCLSVLAYRGWIRFDGKEMSNWRRVLGLLSIIVTSLNWVLFLAITFLAIMQLHTALPWSDLDGVFVLLSLLPIGLCFALKRAPRIQVLIASGLMTALWLTSVVE